MSRFDELNKLFDPWRKDWVNQYREHQLLPSVIAKRFQEFLGCPEVFSDADPTHPQTVKYVSPTTAKRDDRTEQFILRKPLDAVTLSDLDDLIRVAARETGELEFKGALPFAPTKGQPATADRWIEKGDRIGDYPARNFNQQPNVRLRSLVCTEDPQSGGVCRLIRNDGLVEIYSPKAVGNPG